MVLSMTRWIGKVAVVTGASSGIGSAIVKHLVKNGVVVASLARRKDRLDDLTKSLSGQKGELYPVKCDMTKEDNILEAFQDIRKNLGPVNILVNNAGVSLRSPLAIGGEVEKWRKVLETNVLGLCIATKEAVTDMTSNNTNGHIIHINSAAGHAIFPLSYTNLYTASKYAVTALTANLANELIMLKSNIKVTSISPGTVKTEIFEAGGYTRRAKEAEQQSTSVILQPEDVADAVLYALSTPPHVQIQDIIIKPTGEMYG